MKSKYTKKQRVLAILGIILLVGLYLAALQHSNRQNLPKRRALYLVKTGS